MSQRLFLFVDPPKEFQPMFQQLLMLYTAALTTGVTSPLPHFVGPPGSGKSTVVRDLADLVGVKLHTINVSRISPLELEGVQMPDKEHSKLTLLHATFWTQLQDGDILLLDEFLRGFPEVYNGLLDILTAREVGGLKLPNVFIIAASNSVTTYDSALEDRLLHIPVPDPRSNATAARALCERFVTEAGLHPEMVDHENTARLIQHEVLPMFNMLDHFDGAAHSTNLPCEGTSLRNLIGQVKLRHLKTYRLRDVITANNNMCLRTDRLQNLIYEGKRYDRLHFDVLPEKADEILSLSLSPIERANVMLNLQLIEMRDSLTNTEGDTP